MSYLEMTTRNVLEYIKDENLDIEESTNPDALYSQLFSWDYIDGSGGYFIEDSDKAKTLVLKNFDEVLDACIEVGIDPETVGERILDKEYRYRWLDSVARMGVMYRACTIAAKAMKVS